MIKDDSPIGSVDDDAFGRTRIVEFICKALKDSFNVCHPCRCYGIYGKWGEGKTSVLNMVENEIQKLKMTHVSSPDQSRWQKFLQKLRKRHSDHVISTPYGNVCLVRFNPWIISGQKAMLQEFFAKINVNKSGEIEKNIMEYVKHLAGVLSFPKCGVFSYLGLL